MYVKGKTIGQAGNASVLQIMLTTIRKEFQFSHMAFKDNHLCSVHIYKCQPLLMYDFVFTKG